MRNKRLISIISVMLFAFVVVILLIRPIWGHSDQLKADDSTVQLRETLVEEPRLLPTKQDLAYLDQVDGYYVFSESIQYLGLQQGKDYHVKVAIEDHGKPVTDFVTLQGRMNREGIIHLHGRLKINK